jgi:hypothetical protein
VLVLVLYRLFEPVDRTQAVLMVIFGMFTTPMSLLTDAATLTLAHGADFLSAFDKPQRDALAMLFLRLHHFETLGAMVFWGLWLWPLAVLVYKSRFMPRFLGIWLAINGLAYVLQSFVGLLLPQYADSVSDLLFPVELGEVAFMLWLLIMGAKQRPANALAS